MVESLILPRPDDFHVHLRRGSAMGAYARRHASLFGRALVMPNTIPPISDEAQVASYRAEILAALGEGGGESAGAGPAGGSEALPRPCPGFEPLIAFKLRPGMGAKGVLGCVRAGSIAGKYYPIGSTVNSEDGVGSPSQVEEELEAMEEAGIVLSIHGEDPTAPVLEREGAFLPLLASILERWPRLKVVLEHVSTREGLAFVTGGPERLACTVSAHHLIFSLEDLIGEGLDPHLYCKPILKSRADRDALREAVLGGHARIFFGSDSAPHPRAAKEGLRAPAGVYSAPSALPALATLFDEAGALPALRDFVAGRGAAFYGLPPPPGRLRLARESWTVPPETDGAVPMLADETLPWRVAEVSAD